MQKTLSNFIGGLSGAIALNVLHQVVKSMDSDAPRVDLIGEQAVTKGVNKVHLPPPKGKALFATTLAGDLLSNTLYYSGIGLAPRKNLIIAGVGTGLAAGLGAIWLPNKMGLNDEPVTKTKKTKGLTIAWYVIGGVVAALTIQQLRKK